MKLDELNEYTRAKKDVAIIRQSLEDHRSRIAAVGGQDFSGVCGSRYPEDKQAEILDITVRLEQALKAAERRLRAAGRKFTKAIRACEGVEVSILVMRFEEGMSNREISRKIHYSERTISRIFYSISQKIAIC